MRGQYPGYQPVPMVRRGVRRSKRSTARANRRATGPLAARSRLVASFLLCEHMFVPEATILHADLDAFFASVEQRDNPRLRGKPVIVGGGVVLAASYEAKAYGIRTAMGGRQARRLCPHAIVVPPRMTAYSDASRAVFELFEDTTPLVEGLSIDEAFLDVRGFRRLAGPPTDIAVRLRRRGSSGGRAGERRLVAQPRRRRRRRRRGRGGWWLRAVVRTRTYVRI